VRPLLEEYYGVDTTRGRAVGTLADLGQPAERIAQLLQRQRDGTLKQAPLSTELSGVAGPADSRFLSFQSKTVFKPVENAKGILPRNPWGGPVAPNPISEETQKVEAKPIVRLTESRSYLSGGAQPKLVTLWVSALEEQWQVPAEKAKADLLLESFTAP